MTFVLGRMLLNGLIPRSQQKMSLQVGLRRPEAESWERGYLNWLFVDWVNEWISRWGSVENADCTKISAEDLDELGDEEDEVPASYSNIKVMWDAEVDRVGLQ